MMRATVYVEIELNFQVCCDDVMMRRPACPSCICPLQQSLLITALPNPSAHAQDYQD